MAKIKKRGESGAAKNYVTRNQALKKLQISLSDFRRLCILKGIYPRDPLHKKRANKGSSAPASFYYHKDIQYLLHEPLLVKFREHKAFAKKLSRAVGRQEWGLAKNLEEAKPVFRLDHLVKERYPTFQLALQDLQDPLNLVHLFSNLPTNPIPGKTLVPVDIIQGCTRLVAEWKLWALKTHSLRKVFLGIKGIYYECLVPSSSASVDPVPVRWLEGYEFQQHVPHDVDFRILLTFIDLYRTLISFVLYKLYTQENLVYPPPLDQESDERGEGVGAYRLVEKVSEQGASGQGVSKKEVKRAINSIRAGGAAEASEDVDMAEEAEVAPQAQADEEFVERPTKGETDDVASAPLTTYSNLLASSSTPSSSQNLLFSSYTFYLSREISSKTWEFIIRSQGGKVITSVQAPEPSEAKDANSITHVVCDRPMTTERMRSMEGGRKWVWIQPQWIADSINRQKVIGHEEYAPGAMLPPHLSPWDGEGELERPWLGIQEAAAAAGEAAPAEADEEEESEEEEEEDDDEDEAEVDEEAEAPARPALLAAAANASDPALVHAAELEAEALSIPHAKFEAELKALAKQRKAIAKPAAAQKGDEDLRKIMMSNKKAKLYEKMQHGNRERAAEKEKLERRRKEIEKRKAKEARAGKA